MAKRMRPLTSIPEVPSSNPSPAVVPFAKALLSSLPTAPEETL